MCNPFAKSVIIFATAALPSTRPDILRPRETSFYILVLEGCRVGKKRAEEKSVMKYVGRGEGGLYLPPLVGNTTGWEGDA